MNYSEAIKKLFSINLHGGVKLGLENIQHLCRLTQHPEKEFKSIHVAGTNGKGSVCTKIATGLQKAGHKVGLYTSPHISCFRERIRINGEMISEADTLRLLEPLFSLPVPATFFEITTLLAFLYFAEQKVDYVVLETGLGGRLDATNVVTPILSIITSISLEHTHILGNTIEAIAQEKAGIIKEGVPVIIGPSVPLPYPKIHGSFPSFDEENSAIASQAMQILGVPPSIIKEAIQVRPPCRVETVQVGSKTITLDVAHNPDGLRKLFQSLPQKKYAIVCGLSLEKDLTECLKILKEHATSLHFVTATNGRGCPAEKLQELANTGQAYSSIQDGIKAALEESNDIVICGSFFIMQKARESLGFHEPVDVIDLNEKSVKPI